MESHKNKLPSAWVSALPLAVLTLLLYVVIRCFGGDAINGGCLLYTSDAADD